MEFKLPKEFLTFTRLYDRLRGVKKLISLLSIIFCSSNLFATTTLTSITGASRVVQPSTDTTWTVYGGIQGTTFSAFAPDCNVTSACNTCTGTNAATDGACNQTGVFVDTKLAFTGTTDVTTAGAKWLLCGSSEVAASANVATQLTTTWGVLCTSTALGTAGNTDCSTALSSTSAYIGVGVDCTSVATADRIAVKFLTRAVDPSVQSNYVDCPGGSTSAAGACHFELFPGDSKVYLEDAQFYADSTFPAVTNGTSGITYENIIFFSSPKAEGELDGDVVSNITNDASGSEGFTTHTVPVVAGPPASLGGEYLDGLQNETEYCFRMANMDSAGNIDLFTPTSLCPGGSDNTDDCNRICMRPSEVVGILSDKKCFIATAAYGSEMDQHVQMLRNFRNEFMAPFWIGRKMVKTYYALSPHFAQWISKHENARTLARMILWPIIGWAELALQYGWAVVASPFLVFLMGFLSIRSYLRHKKLLSGRLEEA
jgi:hypothetical protein